MTKNRRITIRLPAGEADKLEAQAEAAGMTVSEFTRAALARRLDIDQLAAALARELTAELRSDFQAQAADMDGKLKLISDQVAVLSRLVNQEKRK